MISQRAFVPMQRSTAGMVFVELLVVVQLLVLLLFGITQLMLLGAAQLVVLRASNAAARAAAVVMDDDPRYYGGQTRNAAPAGTPRQAAVQRAAILTLTAIVPSNRRSGRGSILEALTTPDRNQPYKALLTPAPALTRLVNVDVNTTTQTVTTRVQFQYPCLIPLARNLFCKGGNGAYTRALTASATLPNHSAPSVKYRRAR